MSGALARKDDPRGEPAARFLPEVPLARSPRPPLRLVWSAEGSDAPETLEPDAPAHLVAFHRGYMLGAAGEVEKAIAEFRRAIRLKPDHAEAHHNLGVMLGEADRNQEAVDAFVEAIRLKPAYAGAHRDLGVMLADSNEFVPAIASFREAIRLKPDDAQAHYDLGGAFVELGDWAAAIDAFREAIRLSPNPVFASSAYRSLGVALRRTNQLPAAIDAFRAGIALYGDYAPPHFYLGTALHEVGDIVGGIEAVTRAVQIRPGYAAAHFHLGVMFREFGQPHVAVDEFLAALRFGRNDEYRAEATAAIAEILHRQKEVPESNSSEYNAADMDTSAAYAIVARDLGIPVADLKKLRAAHDEVTKAAPAAPRLKWGKNNAPDENPAAFAWRAYQAEAKAGALHMGVIRHEDKPLAVKLANWLRTHPMPEGVDIPTLPEWNTRQLAKLEGSETEVLRLYGVARRRRDKLASPAAV